MKKLALIIGVVGIVGLSSCKKEYTCCVVDGSGDKVTGYTCVTEKYSKAQKDAIEVSVAGTDYKWECE
ncbi:MAG: hypothetical protein ACPGVH_02145 [Chitinophagales bacterium]